VTTTKKTRRSFTSLLAVLTFFPLIAFAATTEVAAASSQKNEYGFPYYNRDHPFKAVFEVPSDPKKWPSVPLVITHNLVSLIGHHVPIKVVLVAPGPTIHFFMKQFNADGYKSLERLHDLGVKMVACDAALLAFNVPQTALFPFVGVAYPSGVVAILKLQSEGYSYETWP